MGKETISRTTLAKGVTACVVVAATLGVIQIGEYSISSGTSSSESSVAVSSDAGNASYTAGTYTASAAGISSDVTVSCTFDENSITAITVDVSGETAGIGADIGDEMIEKFLAAQSSDVDGVTSATVTSDALKTALDDCIAQASGSAGDSGASEEETESEAMTESAADEAETKAVTDDATEDVTEASSSTEAAMDDAAEAESDETTEAAANAEDDAEAAAETAEEGGNVAAEASEETDPVEATGAQYVAGTYTASAAGIASDVTIYCTFDESSITAISVDVSGETDGIGADIGDEMILQFLTAQNSDVDGVSGATVTSDALKAALDDCIAQASGSDGDTGSSVGEANDAETETEPASEESETEEITTEEETVADSASEAETEASDEVDTEAVTEAALETELAEAKDAPFVAGTYTATAEGISSEITVTMTFDETNILEMDADVSGETAGVGALIDEDVINQVLAAQSVDVDGISGATVTSSAILEAAADCIAQASAGTDVSESAELETETEAASEETELAEAEDAPFVAGTYTATAEGISSEITVTMTFDETNILEMDADVSGETAGVGALIDEDVIKQVLTAQSVDVDGISGATVTSSAILEAAADCIAQAQDGSSDDSDEIIGGADEPTEIYLTEEED